MTRILGVLQILGVQLVLLGLCGQEIKGQTNSLRLASTSKDGETRTASLDWLTHAGKSLRIKGNVRKGDEVILDIRSFNFLRYRLKLSVDVDTIRGFAELENLWRQLAIGPSSRGQFAASRGSAFLGSLQQWRTALEGSDARLQVFLRDSAPTDIALLDMHLPSIQAFGKQIEEMVRVIETSRSATYATILAPDATDEVSVYYRQSLYESELARSDAVIKRLRSAAALIVYCIEGQRISVGRFETGNAVTATLTAEAADGSTESAERARAASPTTVKYLVTSGMPVFVHAGVVYSNIKNIAVDKVQVPDAGDVYREITNPNSTAELGIFVGYALGYNDEGDPKLMISLGTDVAHLGNRLYAGASAHIERFWVTFGASTQATKEGENLLDGDVFESFKKNQKVGLFIAVTVPPF